ncbi:MAG: pyruvate kinase [Pseudomonadales bacterium]
MIRRTKIVVTLGPATDKPGMLKGLLLNGANVFRLNFSHGRSEDHQERAKNIRKLSMELDTTVAILGDLQGPKIRIQRFAKGPITLASGARFTLDSSLDNEAGNQHEVGIDYKDLAKYCVTGDVLLLDDGRIRLQVETVDGTRVNCKVEFGGILSNNKGINKLGGGLSAPALTTKDFQDIKTAAAIGVDYIAVSFPSSPEEINQARAAMREEQSDAQVIAKIERAEAVADKELLDEIILASDGVMVARGDLGVEIGDPQLIGIQKYLIRRARSLNRTVITATQMMESMIDAPLPTRAEVFDVANAVLDGTDAVMLSAETAAGQYPLQAVKAMSETCVGAEKEPSIRRSNHRMERNFQRIDEAIAMSAMYTANHLDGVRAIICLTESGSTPLWMSRLSSGLPIYAFSRNAEARRRVSLYRGVSAIAFEAQNYAIDDVNEAAMDELRQRGLVNKGDSVILTKGTLTGIHGGTDSMKILIA